MKKLIKKYTSKEYYNERLQPLNNVKLPRTEFSVTEFGKALFKQLNSTNTHMMSQSVAYGFTMAVFPSIIFLFTLIPYIPVHDLEASILSFLADVMPYSFYKQAYPTIIDIVGKPNGGLLSFGFALALFSAQNGTLALMAAFNISLASTERRSMLKLRLTATILTVLLALVIVSAVILLIVGQIILDYIHNVGILNQDFLYYLLSITKFIVVILLFYVSIGFVYIMGPSRTQRRRFITYGATFSTIFIILVSLAFSLYLNNFANYNKVYGSIGTLIALMIWLYLIAFILIVGFQINSTLYIMKKDRARLKYESRESKNNSKA